MVKGVAHVCFTVGNLEASVAFYRDVLGLTPAFDFTKDGKRCGLYLHAGARTFLELFEGNLAPLAEAQSYRHLCLEVNDVAQTVPEIRSRKWDISDAKMGGDHTWQAWLTDPDGNRIELHSYTPESWQTSSLR